MSRLNESEKLRQNFPELDRAVAATRSLLVDDRILHLLDYSQRQSNYTRSVLDTAVGDVGKFTMTREGPICWLGGSEIDQNVEIQLLPRLSGFTIFAFKGPRWVDYVDKALLKKIISGSLSSQEHEQLKQQSGLIYRDRDKNPVFVDTNIILAVAALKNS